MKTLNLVGGSFYSKQKVVTLKYLTDYGGKYVIFIELYMKLKIGTPLPILKGNDSCKMYNFRFKVRYLEMVYYIWL